MIKKIIIVCLLSYFWSFHILAQNNEINKLLTSLNQTQEKEQRISLLNQIGLYYQKQEAYQKALDYFEQSDKLLNDNNDAKQKINIIQNMAFCYEALNNYPKAIESHLEILNLQKSQNQPILATFEKLSNLYKANNQTAEALNCNMEILEIHRKQGSMVGITNTYNNLGYLYGVSGNSKQSFKYYDNALEINKLLDRNLDDNIRAAMFINTGVAYTQTKNYKSAKKYYDLALSIYTKKRYVSKQAETYNYIAANYYVSANNGLALNAVQQAIELAEATKAEEVLLTSYKIISQIYQKTDDLREFQKYNQLYQNLKDKLDSEAKTRQQKLLENQVDIEKKENELKSLLAENEKRNAALKQSELEKEKQAKELELTEKELALLKRNQQLQMAELRNQQLEKDRTRQLLQLTEQKAREDKQKQEIVLLQKNKELQGLALEKKEAEQKERLKAIELLEKDKKLKDQKLKDGEAIRKYGVGILVLGALVLVLVMAGLYSSNRARKSLKKKNYEIELQQQEILTQNEELYQNQEEILAQRDFIEQKNKELGTANEKMKSNEQILKKAYDQLKQSETQIKVQRDELEETNNRVKSSINAALAIQTAILPYPAKLDDLLKDYFIIFKPKDDVSGDFYWLNKVDEKTVLACVDCTGHGVPGAFMSLIGNTLLDKIVRVWKILEPAQILTKLHEDIQVMLRQEETGNNNGMDVCLVVLEKLADEQTKVIFSGAKNSLIYFPVDSVQACFLEGDRKSIGGEQNEKKFFTNKEVILAKGSVIYLASDGFEDQNDKKRKKFGKKRLVDLLEKNNHLPLAQQQEVLENALKLQMENTNQRDDITLIGVKL